MNQKEISNIINKWIQIMEDTPFLIDDLINLISSHLSFQGAIKLRRINHQHQNTIDNNLESLYSNFDIKKSKIVNEYSIVYNNYYIYNLMDQINSINETKFGKFIKRKVLQHHSRYLNNRRFDDHLLTHTLAFMDDESVFQYDYDIEHITAYCIRGGGKNILSRCFEHLHDISCQSDYMYHIEVAFQYCDNEYITWLFRQYPQFYLYKYDIKGCLALIKNKKDVLEWFISNISLEQ